MSEELLSRRMGVQGGRGGCMEGGGIASYPGSLIIAGEEKRAWFQSLAHALNLTC